MEIKIDIKNCEQCPYFYSERLYTADSFEIPFNWFCKKENNKKIAGYVEWGDTIPIPNWCPARIENSHE